MPVKLDHLDSSASSKYDSTTALNVEDVPICVAINAGKRVTTGHLELSAAIIISVVVVGGKVVVIVKLPSVLSKVDSATSCVLEVEISFEDWAFETEMHCKRTDKISTVSVF